MILEKFFRAQRDAVLAWLDDERVHPQQKVTVSGIIEGIANYLPATMLTVVAWSATLYKLLRPVLGTYALEAAEEFWQRVVGVPLTGGPPGTPQTMQTVEDERRPILETGFDVINPKLNQAVDQLTLTFCEETNQTTSLALANALAQTGEAIREGVVEGLAMDELTKRVNAVFDQAETWRAKRIAVTESSRAVHLAQDISAKESGVVWGFEWLVSADACPLCMELAGKRVPLGTPFVRNASKIPDYADIYYAPRHPECQCTTIEILKEEVDTNGP